WSMCLPCRRARPPGQGIQRVVWCLLHARPLVAPVRRAPTRALPIPVVITSINSVNDSTAASSLIRNRVIIYVLVELLDEELGGRELIGEFVPASDGGCANGEQLVDELLAPG